MRLGILSDTHGLLRPEALARLAGCDLVLHAGDVGEEGILVELARLAPVVAVRGNTDAGELARRLPSTAEGELGGLAWRMTHRREDVPVGWTRTPGLVVFGHSHRPELEWRGQCLLLNPGACGRRRFSLPLTVARVAVRDGAPLPEILSVEG